MDIEISATRELVLGGISSCTRAMASSARTASVSEEAYRPIGRLFADRYCTTRRRFDLPGDLPEWPAAGTLRGNQAEILLASSARRLLGVRATVRRERTNGP